MGNTQQSADVQQMPEPLEMWAVYVDRRFIRGNLEGIVYKDYHICNFSDEGRARSFLNKTLSKSADFRDYNGRVEKIFV
jgi:hypothetical protein